MDMAKTRLNQTHRQALVRFAVDNVSCPDEQEARDRDYAAAADLVKADVEKRFVPKDMAVLQKYEAARADHCIQGGSPEGMFLRFQFDSDDDRAPLVPARYCSSRSIPFSDKTAAAIQLVEKSDEALKRAKQAKIEAYKALIFSARTYEEVLEIWPAAAALSDRIGSPSTALAALSDDIAALIRNDNAGSVAAA